MILHFIGETTKKRELNVIFSNAKQLAQLKTELRSSSSLSPKDIDFLNTPLKMSPTFDADYYLAAIHEAQLETFPDECRDRLWLAKQPTEFRKLFWHIYSKGGATEAAIHCGGTPIDWERLAAVAIETTKAKNRKYKAKVAA